LRDTTSTYNKGINLAINWLPVLVLSAAIFYFSSLPGEDLPFLFPFQDIVFHLLSYCLLCYFFRRALKRSTRNLLLIKSFILTVFFGIIFGISDEIHQGFVPGRNVSSADILVDGIGSFFGAVFYR